MAWLDAVHALRARKGIDREGRLLLLGSRLAAAAWRAGARFERALYAPELASDAGAVDAILSDLRTRGVPCDRVDRRTFSRISYKADGIVAIVRHRAPSLGDVLAREGLVLALDALSDPGNVGAIVRSANAWRAAGVIAIEGHEKLFHPKSLLASTGAIFHTPTCASSRDGLLRAIGARPLIVLAPDGARADLAERRPNLAVPPDAIVVLGNERRGAHPDLVRRATARLAIPTAGAVDSLNVSHAAAIVLWESFHSTRSGA